MMIFKLELWSITQLDEIYITHHKKVTEEKTTLLKLSFGQVLLNTLWANTMLSIRAVGILQVSYFY